MKQIDLEAILEKHYQDSYKNTKEGELYPSHWEDNLPYLKNAINEYTKQVLDIAAEEVILKVEENKTTMVSGLIEPQCYVDNKYQVVLDIESILKIKERL